MARTVLGWAGLATAAALTAALVPLPSTTASNAYGAREQQRSPRPETQVDEVAVPAVLAADAAAGDGVVARLDRTGTDPYRMVAVTWAADAGVDDVRPQIRIRDAGGWGRWQRLDVDEDGPAAARTAGTAPLWVDRADGVAVRVRSGDGVAPAGLRVVTIDPPGVTSADRLSGTAPAAGDPASGVPAFPGRPPIVTREQWHADPDLGDTCDAPIYGRTTKAAIIHHTAGTNDYSRSDSVGIVQGILAYHTQSRHWCDIGYNFLVDRFGRVFEGRDGGMAKPVRGAHSGDFNVNTVGVSMMGDFSTAGLPVRLRNAVVRIVGWRLGTNYVRPKGRAVVHGTRIARISGHRDVMSTACPGQRGYAWLPRLRVRVARYLSGFDSAIRAKRDALGVSRTGPVFVGERRIDGGRRARFARGAIFWKSSTGAHYIPRGTLLRGYERRGGPRGRLGFPDSDYSKTEDGGKTRFEHGELRYDKRTRKLTVKYW